MKMWIARTQGNELCIFREKPFLLKLPELICPIWIYETQLNTGDSWKNIGERIDSNAFPEVTFENSPMEVELVLKKNGLHFSPMFRLLGMIINKDPSDRKRIVGYTKKLIDNLKEEGFDADARVAEDYLKAFNGEQVGMATMDEVELVIKK